MRIGLAGGQYQYSGEGEDGGLADAVPGSPGQDYPVLHAVPDTSFSCAGQVIHQLMPLLLQSILMFGPNR